MNGSCFAKRILYSITRLSFRMNLAPILFVFVGCLYSISAQGKLDHVYSCMRHARMNNNNTLFPFAVRMLDCTQKICELTMNIVN